MNRMLFAIVLAVVLAACTRDSGNRGASDETPLAEPGPTTTATIAAGAVPVDQAPDADVLAAFHWRLDDAVDADGRRIDALLARVEQPVQLDFGQGRLSISNTCNRMSGAYAIEASRLQVGRLMSTMMACADDALTQLDQALAASVQGLMSVAVQASEGAVRLTLSNEAGDVLIFSGQPTAETRYGGPGVMIFLEVAAQTQPCSHALMPAHECLQARQVAFDEQGLRTGTPGAFEHFYGVIEGFTHEPGLRTVLRVRRFDRDPVPADASAHAYVLDLIVESEQR